MAVLNPTAFNYNADANTDDVHVFRLSMVVQTQQCGTIIPMQIQMKWFNIACNYLCYG